MTKRLSWKIGELRGIEPFYLNIGHDVEHVTNMFKLAYPSFSNESVKTYRVGRKTDSKSRPLKVILGSVEDARRIFANFSTDAMLKLGQVFSAVKIARDRTPPRSRNI
ncbi:hypothetical protein J6590_057465 [Homalodisca vitripennis]|nr:hypothetical protein J6590_057465 [Homalodisca vitripennis]